MKDYYKILGLDSNSSERDINHAYRKLSLKFHPDKNPDFHNPNEIVKKQYYDIQEAHDVLSDINYRKAYDYEYTAHHPLKSKPPFPKSSETTETKYKNPSEDIIIKPEKDWSEMYKDIEKRMEEMKHFDEMHKQWAKESESFARWQEELANGYKRECAAYEIDPTKKLIQTLESNNGRTSWCVAELLKNGADANAHNSKGEYLPTLAARLNDLESLSLLVKAGAKSGLEDALIEAAYKNNTAITKYLIDAKAYVNYYQKYYGAALDVAIKNNNAEITHHLIAAGADTRKYFDHPFLETFKENPIKFALDNALKVENAVRAIARMDGQFHLNLSDELDATSDCLAKLDLSQSYENLNEICGIDGQMIDY